MSRAHQMISEPGRISPKLTINNPPGGLDQPYQTTGNPFPFVPPQTPQERGNYRFLTPMAMTQWDPDVRNAIAQQWNVNLQQQLFGSYLVTIAYVAAAPIICS